MNVNQKSADKLQKLQNRALRICFAREGRTNVNELHNTCNINKLRQRTDTHLLNFMYKRAHMTEYTQDGNLQRFDTPVITEIKSNNKSFERSVLFQGAARQLTIGIQQPIIYLRKCKKES